MALLNLFSLLLTLVTFVSYIPQYHRLLTLGSSAGLSVSSVLASTLVAQSQTANTYYLWDLSMRYGTPIATPPSTRDWLNLSQILIQWICSLLLFALVIYLPNSTISPAPALLSKKIAVLFWGLHVILFIVSILVAGRPEDMFFTIISNINSVIATPLFTLLAVAAFFLQVCAASPTEQSNVLSKWTLGLQFFAFLLLAISWPFRLILPPSMWEYGMRTDGPILAILLTWYPWVGWACINNAIFAIGQGIILFFCTKKVEFDPELGVGDERRPLLGSEEL